MSTEFEKYEMIIGLEIHAQLNTKTKLFSSTPNKFGQEPNTQIGVTDTGLPGSLPLLNEEAVRKVVLFGHAVQANIAKHSLFDRKSYFYPDCPRNYQITQFFSPILMNGFVEAELHGKTKRFEIEKAHIEDDAGMLKHFNDFAGVDYNRAGAPLIEIVSTPCMRSPDDAVAYAMAIKNILEYIDASSTNMEEGALRMDVNVSVRLKEEKELRPKAEIKNMNSFTNMAEAIEAEFKRQVSAYESSKGAPISTGTFRYDPQKKVTILMRTKEDASDYRYFPEPDLPPLVLTAKYLEDIKRELPELPFDRLKRYKEEHNLSSYAAELLINDKTLCEHFESGMKHAKNARSFCNWLTVEFMGRAKQQDKAWHETGVNIDHIAELVNLIDEGVITGKIGKEIADMMMEPPHLSPKEILNKHPELKPLNDESFVDQIVKDVLKENTQSIADYQNGIQKAYNYLVGQIMKKSRGKAPPEMVNALLKNYLDK